MALWARESAIRRGVSHPPGPDSALKLSILTGDDVIHSLVHNLRARSPPASVPTSCSGLRATSHVVVPAQAGVTEPRCWRPTPGSRRPRASGRDPSIRPYLQGVLSRHPADIRGLQPRPCLDSLLPALHRAPRETHWLLLPHCLLVAFHLPRVTPAPHPIALDDDSASVRYSASVICGCQAGIVPRHGGSQLPLLTLVTLSRLR